MLRHLSVFAICMVCATFSGVAQTLYEPLDTIAIESTLPEIMIEVERPRPAVEMRNESAGNFRLGAASLSQLPQFLGTPDPIRLMQTLPAISSSDCISGGLYIQGSEAAHNRVTIDGLTIYNPIHLLGLFSVFNTNHFDTFDIDTNPEPTSSGNFVGAGISANTSWHHPPHLGGDISAGLIESAATLKLPVAKEKASVILSGRTTYVNAIFGDAIKVENAPLKYGFCDLNLSYLQNIGQKWQMKMDLFYSHDHMRVCDPNYASVINMGWDNLAIGATFRETQRQQHTIGLSRYGNDVRIQYTNIDKPLPSRVSSLEYSGKINVWNLDIEGGAIYRRCDPQHSNKPSENLFSPNALETCLGAVLPISLSDKFSFQPGCKFVYYWAENYSKILCLPNLSFTFSINEFMKVYASLSRRAQFTHKIEESAMGLPTDFWIVADSRNNPLEMTEGTLGMKGSALHNNFHYYVGFYYRRFNNLTDWIGNLFSMLNADYEPLSDVVNGNGRSLGVSTMVQGSAGSFSGWISYTLSKSQQKFPAVSDKWFVYSHDRTHDLKITAAWKIRRNLILSATFIYATGNPYTEPLYGYMIGENLILEFKERNSSRLPDMHRLDLGLNWSFLTTGHFSHSLTIGVFNAYGHDNVMNKSFTYKPATGISPTKWSMAYILPSVSYNIKF